MSNDPEEVEFFPTAPHSREAEDAVCGSVLINPGCLVELSSFLQAEDFYIHRNRFIWETFIELQEKRSAIDYLTVVNQLDANGKLDEIGGSAYLTSLINQVPSSLNAESYGRVVESNAIRRKLLEIANLQAQMAYNEGMAVSDALDASVSQILSIRERSASDKHMRTLGESLSESYDRVFDIVQNGRPLSIPSGLLDIDRILHGFHNEKFYIIATRPGLGKSALLQTIAAHVSGNLKKNVGIFSIEMDNIEVANRLISIHTRILKSFHLNDGQLLEQEWPVFTHAVEEMADWPMWIDDTPAITPERIFAKSRKMHQLGKLDLLMVDYIQIMGISEKFGSKLRNREQEVSHMARMMKFISRELKIPVIAAAQVNRSVDARADHRLVLSDLRESGSLEQEADVVMFLQPPKEETAVERDIEVTKHRGGPLGRVQLLFRGEFTGFYNLRKEDDRRNWWE